MSKIKKEKYIRDLFEDGFSTNLFNFIDSIDEQWLSVRFYRIRRFMLYKILSQKRFNMDAPNTLFKVVNENEKFTLKKYRNTLFQIEQRKLLYQLYDYKFNNDNEKVWKQKKIILKECIRKIFKKSIDNFVKKQKFIFGVTRSAVILTVLQQILDNSLITYKKQTSSLKRKDRTMPLSKRNAFLASEYEHIVSIYKAYKKVKTLPKEDIIFYIISKLGYEYNDNGLEFVVANGDKNLTKKDLAILFLKEEYGLTLNKETIDKKLDRGRIKRDSRETTYSCYQMVDNLLRYYNSYEFDKCTKYKMKKAKKLFNSIPLNR